MGAISAISRTCACTANPTVVANVTSYGNPRGLSIDTREHAIRHVFPGGAYKVPQTIFDLLEDEGIQIPEDLRYFDPLSGNIRL